MSDSSGESEPSATDRFAEAAERFDERLKIRHSNLTADEDTLGDLGDPRIVAVLKLLHAAIQGPSTRTTIGLQDSTETFEMPSHVGRFLIGEQIGRGGFGVVFRARDEMLQRDVAIKAVPRRDGAPTGADDRRLGEARAAARLKHPYLVPLYEVIEDESCVYLISEFCDGPNLFGFLNDQAKRMHPEWAVAITIKLGQAVAHAHSRGLAHRDIKPGNVIMVAEAVEGETLPFTPRLTDFGLAMEVSDDFDSQFHPRLAGTVLYMAPEQITGGVPYDARRGDVYSLGLLLVEMLCGKLPYRASDPMKLLEEMCVETLSTSIFDGQSVDRDLQAICLKALQKQPQDRYESVRILVNDLEHWRDGRAVSARPQSMPEKTWRSIRRAPGLSGMVVALVTLAIASAITFAISNQTLRKQSVALQQAMETALTLEEQAVQAEASALRSRDEAERQQMRAEAKQSEATQIAYLGDLLQAYTSMARTDVASTRAMIHQIEGYVDDGLRQRFDLRLIKSLSESGWKPLPPLGSMVEEVVLFPNQDRFAVAGGDVIQIHAGNGQEEIREIKLPSGSLIHALAVSPNGQEMAVGFSTPKWLGLFDPGNAVRVLNLADEFVRREWTGFPTTVDALAFSVDGKTLAVGMRYEPVQLFAIDQDEPLKFIESDRRNEELFFNKNDHLVLMPTKQKILVRDWNQDTDVLIVSRTDIDDFFRRIAASSDGRWIAASTDRESDGRLYDLNDGDAVPLVLKSSHGELLGMCFSPDAKWLSGGTVGGGVVAWKLDPSVEIQSEQSYQWLHGGQVTAVAINDAGVCLSGSEDGGLAIQCIDRQASSGQLLIFEEDSTAAAMSRDGKTAMVGCRDGSLWKVDATTGRRERCRSANGVRITAVAWSGDESFVAVGSEDGTLAVGLTDSMTIPVEMSSPSKLADETRAIMQIAFNGSGKRVVVRHARHAIQWVDVETLSDPNACVRLKPLTVFHAPTSIESFALLDDNVAITLGDVIRFAEADEEFVPYVQSRGGFSGASCLCFDSIKQLIFAGAVDGRIRIVNRDGKIIQTSQRWSPLLSSPEVMRKITTLALSPDRKTLFAGSDLGDVAIFDTTTLRYLGQVFPADHAGEIEKISLSDDGGMLMVHQSRHILLNGKSNGKLRLLPIK